MAKWLNAPSWKSKRGEATCFTKRVATQLSLEVWTYKDFNAGKDGWLSGIRWRKQLINFSKACKTQKAAQQFVEAQLNQLQHDLK